MRALSALPSPQMLCSVNTPNEKFASKLRTLTPALFPKGEGENLKSCIILGVN